MQITKATEYGVRIILELSSRSDLKQPVSIQELSEKQDIPVKYLRKLILLLINSKLVRSYRGSKGGIVLVRRPEDVTIYDVLKITEGDLALNVCLMGEDECERQKTCPVHKVWEKAQKAMMFELENANFKDLAKKL